jgi:hypothetical protein
LLIEDWGGRVNTKVTKVHEGNLICRGYSAPFQGASGYDVGTDDLLRRCGRCSRAGKFAGGCRLRDDKATQHTSWKPLQAIHNQPCRGFHELRQDLSPPNKLKYGYPITYPCP